MREEGSQLLADLTNITRREGRMIWLLKVAVQDNITISRKVNEIHEGIQGAQREDNKKEKEG